ncbi:MAG: 5-oxoprolinase subunit PxpA [Bacteroidota bacterium]
MQTIDLNCDMGEGLSNDAMIMPWISSTNIACGYHAGDEDTMKRTVELAIQNNVSIGAHPGFADKTNFGRTEMRLSLDEVYELVAQQIFLLQKITKEFGARLHHVKPHGALYNMAANDTMLAHTIAKAVNDIDGGLFLYGLSGSHSISEANKLGLKTASEVFADRTYQDSGGLTPRTQSNALIETEEASLQQVLQMIEQQTVTSVNKKQVPIKAETICLHGDGVHAVAFAKNIYHTLQQNQVGIKSI